MLRATLYRRGQAGVVLALSALVTACLVFAPMYTAALGRAALASRLALTSSADLSLSVVSSSVDDPTLTRTPEQLAAYLPPDLAAHFDPPIRQRAVVVRPAGRADVLTTRLTWREGQCAHLRFTAGRCPSRAGEVAVSAAELTATPAWGVGRRIDVSEWDEAVPQNAPPPRRTLTVVGVYTPVPGAYWLGDTLTGYAGPTGYDALVVDEAALTTPPWLALRNGADFALRPGTLDVTDVGRVGARLATFVQAPWASTATSGQPTSTPPVTATTGLPALADAVRHDGEQARVTVPVLMTQLALLLLVVLWLVMVAATDQRRAEVAVAKLRGRGSTGSRRLLLTETLPPVLLGAPAGALLAVCLSYVARHLILPGGLPFEVPTLSWVALGGSLLGMGALTVLSVRRVCGEPVAALLRSVPPRVRGITLGILEAMVLAASVSAFVALATHSVSGPVALAAPTLLAVAAGILGARVVPLAVRVLGRRLLGRGRIGWGAALLQAGRRGATRWVIPVVTVGLCLVVFTANALAVSLRNRDERAGVDVGAPAVLRLDTSDARLARTAVEAADPGGRHATPVALIAPPDESAAVTMGVVPRAFERIASWPGSAGSSRLPWAALTPPPFQPVMLRGTTFTARVASTGLSKDSSDAADPRTLGFALQVVGPTGQDRLLRIATLSPAAAAAGVRVSVPCGAGCPLIGLAIQSPAPQADVGGVVSLAGVALDGRPVDLGAADRWASSTVGGGWMLGQDVPGGIQLSFRTSGAPADVLPSRAQPLVVPAVTSAAATPSSGDVSLSGQAVDGRPLPLAVVGHVAAVPGGHAATYLVNVDSLLVHGWQGSGARMFAYVDTDDPAYLAGLTERLGAHGIRVEGVTRQATAERLYAQSAAAWSMQLALVVGVLSVAAAALALLVLIEASWRPRSRDYAGLRMAGLPPGLVRRIAVGELVPVVLVSAVVGIVAGLFAAHTGIPLVPLFATSSTTYAVDLHLAWGAALGAALLALLVLVGTGTLASTWVARRSGFDRLRESA